ncbi:MAG: hypothetical protein DRH12_13265 [Deltaproteobacteria bacterium]|nr:MAG: hypothetical protein DRH12_13265 [Deltaproteobacteria bacterium]
MIIIEERVNAIFLLPIKLILIPALMNSMYYPAIFFTWSKSFQPFNCKISKSLGIPTASPFCKGGLREIFLIQPGFIENLHLTLDTLVTSFKY